MMSGSDSQYLRYTVVTGFFKQDDPATDPNGFDYVRILASIHIIILTSAAVDVEFWFDKQRL
jgi:hypothetical protein